MEDLENQSTWTSWSFSCFWPITFVEPEILIKCYGSDFKLDISFLSWLVSKLSESPIFWPWVEENRNLSELHSLWVSARLIWVSSNHFEWAPAKFGWAPTDRVRMCIYFIFWITFLFYSPFFWVPSLILPEMTGQSLGRSRVWQAARFHKYTVLLQAALSRCECTHGDNGNDGPRGNSYIDGTCCWYRYGTVWLIISICKWQMASVGNRQSSSVKFQVCIPLKI